MIATGADLWISGEGMHEAGALFAKKRTTQAASLQLSCHIDNQGNVQAIYRKTHHFVCGGDAMHSVLFLLHSVA